MATGDDGVAALKLIHGAYQLAEPMNMPWLSAEEQSLLNRTHWKQSPQFAGVGEAFAQ